MDVLAGFIADGATLIGIGGSQASGKSTLCREAAERFGGVSFSLDDIYLTLAERTLKAAELHPLFKVRGVPGTHDLKLGNALIDSLRTGGATIPVFDKLADDRAAEGRVFEGRPKVIFVEGWCLGAVPQPPAMLFEPVNTLEASADPNGTWRRVVNGHLQDDYARFFGRFEKALYLAAPGFETVLDWRCEQEAGLLGVEDLPEGRREALKHFIDHYERLTRWMISGGVKADVVVPLDKKRNPQTPSTAFHGS
jgi:D-glycerate 3-kinase